MNNYDRRVLDFHLANLEVSQLIALSYFYLLACEYLNSY